MRRLRVIVCGGRDYKDWATLHRVLDAVWPNEIIEGGAAGADEMARYWAKGHDVMWITVEAEWEIYGRAAGPRRNAAMLILQPDLVIAFPGGRGTDNMIQQALRKGVPVMTI